VSETLRITAPPQTGDVLSAAIHGLDDIDASRILAGLAEEHAGRRGDVGLAGGATAADRARGDAPGAVFVALAWLAYGRASRVRELLRGLATAQPAPAPALLPLLVARYVAWTGDLRTAIGVWPAVRRAALALAAPAAPAHPRAAGGPDAGEPRPQGGPDADDADAADDLAAVLVAGGVAGTEHAAADLGDPQLAARLHARSRDLTAVLAERALAGRAALLAAALDLPRPAVRSGGPTVRSEPDEHLPHRGSDALDEPADAAAATVLEAVHLLLGAAPDAARHRLWLRPRLPDPGGDTDRLEARSILVGDDSVSLVLERTAETLIARVEQEAGPIPLTVLLELYVPGPLRRAVVDGRDAGLAPRPAGAGLVVPVQLVLDHARTVELEL
jgi:hypothetical protein